MMRRFQKGSHASKVSFFAFQDIITSVTGVLILITLLLTLYIESFSAQPPVFGLAELEKAAALGASNRVMEAALATVNLAPDIPVLEADVESLRAERDREAARRQILSTEFAQWRDIDFEHVLGLDRLSALIAETKADVERTRARRVELEQIRNASATAAAPEIETAVADNASDQKPPALWLIPDMRQTSKEPVVITVGDGAYAVLSNEGAAPVAGRDSDAAFADLLNGLDFNRNYIVFYVRPSGIATFHRWRGAAKAAGFDVGHDAILENQEIHLAPNLP